MQLWNLLLYKGGVAEVRAYFNSFQHIFWTKPGW